MNRRQDDFYDGDFPTEVRGTREKDNFDLDNLDTVYRGDLERLLPKDQHRATSLRDYQVQHMLMVNKKALAARWKWSVETHNQKIVWGVLLYFSFPNHYTSLKQASWPILVQGLWLELIKYFYRFMCQGLRSSVDRVMGSKISDSIPRFAKNF